MAPPPAPARPPGSVTVVVATRNRWEDLRRSLPRHPRPVLLLDNGSTDGTPGLVRSTFPDVTVVELGRNRGAVARNVGVDLAPTPYVAFADDDSWWAPGALDIATELLDAFPRLAVLAGHLLVGEEERPDPVCELLAESPLPRADDLPGPSVLGFLSCAAVVRREAFLAAGGFDDVVFFLGEEERLALDLAARGWGLAYCEQVVAHHHPSPARDRRARAIRAARNRLLTAVLRRPWPFVLAVLREELAGPVGRAGAVRALARLHRALADRRPVPPAVESARALLDHPGPPSAARPSSSAALLSSIGCRRDVEYVLPLRWSPQTSASQTRPLAGYLRELACFVDVTVVDGSAPAEFDEHARHWSPYARVLRPQPWPGRNGKVAGVVTGVRAARHEAVVIADDDVRYDPQPLREVLAALQAGADLVGPQNVFSPAPWHARWDTGRSLLNRAFGTDFPGTYGVRRSAFLAVGGYDGDVLFENLELVRTFTARGRQVVHLPGTYVLRAPPTTRQFASQRVRQAYDEFARPGRLAAQLAVLPTLWALRRAPGGLLAAAAVTVLAAERGRRRAGGAAVYPPTAPLWAVPWCLERAGCVWLALLQRARGGARYRGERLPRAATPMRELRASVPAPLSPLAGEADAGRFTGPAAGHIP